MKMKKIRKEFKTMSEVTSFLRTIEASQEVRKEIASVIKNIEKVLGYPYAEINYCEHFGNDYKKESYVSEVTQGFNSYDENFSANIRVKTENAKLIVLIDYFKYIYSYGGNESDENAILKIAYTD